MITGQTVLGAYLSEEDEHAYPIEQLPAGLLTHLFYAFATVEGGHLALPPTAPARLAAIKRAHPHLRIVISIGGWDAGGFSDAALTARTRADLAGECLDLVTGLGCVDGVDLDWEYPVSGGPAELTHRPEDRRNFTLLARELRDRLGPDRLLTAALPAGRLQAAGPYDPSASFELAALADLLDFVNLMTYDFGTGFSGVATFNAPLAEVADDPLDPGLRRWNNVTGAVDYYERHGVPPARHGSTTPVPRRS